LTGFRRGLRSGAVMLCVRRSRAMALVDDQMREASEEAASLIEPGMRVGLGTGRTVAWLLRVLADRHIRQLRCVATSLDTERNARRLGIPVEPFDEVDPLDIAIDGADQVTSGRWANHCVRPRYPARELALITEFEERCERSIGRAPRHHAKPPDVHSPLHG
jgi:hypothetical protein